MKKGDPVKLSERGLRIYTSSASRGRSKQVDWKSRRGVVFSVSRSNDVRVIWDGCRSPDMSLPMAVFEVIPSTVDAV